MSDLELLKEDLLKVSKRTQEDGLCIHKSGNASVRDDDTGLFVFTPAQLDRDEMSSRDLCVVDQDAKVVSNPSGLKPTSELLMHLAIYKLRPEVKAVVHTHSRTATAFAVLGKPIPAIVYELQALGAREGQIPVAPYARPGTQELADNVARTTLQSDSVLMEHHGTVACGSNIYDAFLKATYIEELARIYAITLQVNGGKEPEPLAPSEIVKWAYPHEVTFDKKTATDPSSVAVAS